MKKSTVGKYRSILRYAKMSKCKSLTEYCRKKGINYNSIMSAIHSIRNQAELESKEVKKLIQEYEALTDKVEKVIEAETTTIRNKDGLIESYSYSINRKNRPTLSGNFTRGEMETIYRLYSYYGSNLTQRVISRHFPDISLVDFKRILKAFNIYKANSPFPIHMLEERNEEELRDIQTREKENDLLNKIEEDRIRNNEKLLRKFVQENYELKKKLEDRSSINITVSSNIEPIKIQKGEPNNKALNLYLADFHIGAKVVHGTLYPENKNYGPEELKRRLSEVIIRLSQFDRFDTLNICLMGDMIDCCGFEGFTARRDHLMPENMDPKQQVNVYIELMIWFIESLIKTGQYNNINVYSVPNGNHDGTYGYVANKALLTTLNIVFPDIKTTLFEEFYGVFEQNCHRVVICHGKENEFMKRNLPNELNDRTKIMLYEWMESKGLYGDNIHIIKGDLHSNNMSSCKKFTYRNVLSLFGASDYANYNFSRNSYGVSYDMFIGVNMISGTFENM